MFRFSLSNLPPDFSCIEPCFIECTFRKVLCQKRTFSLAGRVLDSACCIVQGLLTVRNVTALGGPLVGPGPALIPAALPALTSGELRPGLDSGANLPDAEHSILMEDQPISLIVRFEWRYRSVYT